MSGGFKRSGVFGLVGVFVVAGLAIAIATTMGEGQANPKLALGLIFGVIAIFFVGLFAFQRSDLTRAAGGDEAWDVGRRSQNLGMVIVALIFLTVPAIYLTESFVPLLVGGPLIAIAALYGAFRAIGPGGEISQSYERTDRAMKPLGLQVSERPQGGFEMRMPTTPGFDYRLRGWTVLSGERHGRQVAVRLGGHEDAGTSEVYVGEPCADFVVGGKRLDVETGPKGIVVTRRKGEQRDWLCDLWLAERLASN